MVFLEFCEIGRLKNKRESQLIGVIMAWAIFNDMPMWLQVAEGRLTEILPIKYSNALAQNIAVNYADSGDHYDMAVVSLLHAIRLYRNQTKPCLKNGKTPSWGIFFRQDCVAWT